MSSFLRSILENHSFLCPGAEFTIINADVITSEGILETTDVVVENGRIKQVGKGVKKLGEVHDASGKYLVPGLIDIHTHGRLINLDPEKIPSLLEQDCMDFVRNGVTRFLPTLASGDLPRAIVSLNQARPLRQGAWPRAAT